MDLYSPVDLEPLPIRDDAASLRELGDLQPVSSGEEG